MKPQQITEQCQRRAERAAEFLKLYGYEVKQVNGQRITRSDQVHEFPGEDSARNEIFIGKLPRDMFEDELLPFLSYAGRVFNIRLMMDFSCSNRGYAFAKYTNTDDALNAVILLNEQPIRPFHQVGIMPSFNNRKLYIGNLPYNCTDSILKNQLQNQLGETIESVSMSEPLWDSGHATRSAYVTFKTHRDATNARRVLVPGEVCMVGRALTVDWAKPDEAKYQNYPTRSYGSDLFGVQLPMF